MTIHPAIAAGIATAEEAARLDEFAAAQGVDIHDLVMAIGRRNVMTLDNIGIEVRAPTVPRPEPDPDVVSVLCRMYGVDPEDPDRDRDDARREAAYRTAEAMERRRQGWTREGARDEFHRQVLAKLNDAG